MTAIYLSGPMTGIADHNFPAFNEATGQLRDAGFEVRNPAEGGAGEMSWADYLRRDLRDVIEVDGLAVLPDWDLSKGARLEVRVARELGMPVGSVSDWLTGVEPRLLPVPQLEQLAVHDWSVRNFGDSPQTLVTLGLAEEVGELCRAVLKREQGIRGTREEWDAEVRKEIGDCVIKLLDISAYEGLSLVQAFTDRWEAISKRDWVADRTGRGIPA